NQPRRDGQQQERQQNRDGQQPRQGRDPNREGQQPRGQQQNQPRRDGQQPERQPKGEGQQPNQPRQPRDPNREGQQPRGQQQNQPRRDGRPDRPQQPQDRPEQLPLTDVEAAQPDLSPVEGGRPEEGQEPHAAGGRSLRGRRNRRNRDRRGERGERGEALPAAAGGVLALTEDDAAAGNVVSAELPEPQTEGTAVAEAVMETAMDVQAEQAPQSAPVEPMEVETTVEAEAPAPVFAAAPAPRPMEAPQAPAAVVERHESAIQETEDDGLKFRSSAPAADYFKLFEEPAPAAAPEPQAPATESAEEGQPEPTAEEKPSTPAP
ncbi:MAG TPA: hypothetical protein VLI06_01445, partial [Solimonas sp.]|nr:hypothetical protein [Solimonas sp.]